MSEYVCTICGGEGHDANDPDRPWWCRKIETLARLGTTGKPPHGLTLRRWAESLLRHAEDRDGLVWVTKAEVQAVLDAAPSTPAGDGLRATEAQARAFHEMTQVGGPWSPCSGPFGEPVECLCYEMASDALDALSAEGSFYAEHPLVTARPADPERLQRPRDLLGEAELHRALANETTGESPLRETNEIGWTTNDPLDRPAPSTPAGNGLLSCPKCGVRSSNNNGEGWTHACDQRFLGALAGLPDRYTLAASQPRNEDGLDVERLARATAKVSGYATAFDEPAADYHRTWARRVADEYAAQSGEAAGEGEGRG